MEERDLWLKKMKERLSDHTEPMPDAGWQRLEKELSPSAADPSVRPVSKVQSGSRIGAYRWWAAAAVVLVAVSSVSIYFLRSPEAEIMRHVSSAFVPDGLPQQVTPHTTGETEKAMEALRPRKHKLVARNETKVNKPAEGSEATGQLPSEKMETMDTTGSTLETGQKDESQQGKHNTKTPTDAPRQNTYRPSGKDKYQILTGTTPRKTGKWSVGMSVGGIGTPSLDGTNVDYGNGIVNSPDYADVKGSSNGLLNFASDYIVSFKEGMPFLQNKNDVIDTRHKQPISFGISVRKALTKNLSIESGLIYTQLSSEIKTVGNPTWQDQKLHYIGIPLRAGWTFYQKDRFTLYTSAGGTVEKCVYGELDGEKNTVDALQLSIGGAAGAQLNLSKHFGLYVEPGVTYYFDDGSLVETIRKDKPFNFNLQAGFRLNY